MAARDFHFVLDSNVVWQDGIAVRAIAEQADDAGMRAIEDSNDAALGALRTETGSGAALDSCKDMVAVHGVFDGVAGNEDIAIELRHWSIGNNKAIAIVMEDQAAFYFIVIPEGGALRLRRLTGMRRLAGCIAILFSAGKTVATAGQFLDGVAFLQFREHFEKGASVGLF
jgi:hypothetical protein